MKTIYKYHLTTDREIIYLPVGAKILSVKGQRGQCVIYAMIDTSVKGVVAYEFLTVVTGGFVDHTEGYTYLDTVLFGDNQTYVEHVFYKKLGD